MIKDKLVNRFYGHQSVCVVPAIDCDQSLFNVAKVNFLNSYHEIQKEAEAQDYLVTFLSYRDISPKFQEKLTGLNLRVILSVNGGITIPTENGFKLHKVAAIYNFKNTNI
ncbi:hypothetical protein ACPV33_02420 [Vibrio harveyi]|uniref:hypothetical protein n=1 Tax=Vibrio harveyi TaxID=669 RepID=UPI004068C572